MKNIYLILIGIILYSKAYSQYYTPDKPGVSDSKGNSLFKDWKDKIYFGGNIGFGFYPKSNYLYIQASPLVGYNITDRFSLGNTFTYIYLRQNLYYTNGNGYKTLNYSSHIFGVSPFTRMFLLDWLFLHAEYNIFSGHMIKQSNNEFYTERGFVAYPLVGGGIVYRFGAKGGLMLMALYNPFYSGLQNKFPIYNSPLVLRVGFFF